jgi:hypothetical protein
MGALNCMPPSQQVPSRTNTSFQSKDLNENKEKGLMLNAGKYASQNENLHQSAMLVQD